MNMAQIPGYQDNQIWIDGYAANLLGKTEGTIDAYVRIVRQFLDWLLEKPGGSDGFQPEQFTRTAVESYLKELELHKISVSHRTRVKSVLGSFAEWLVNEKDLLRKNPTKGIRIPAKTQLAPRELSDDQRYILKSLVEKNDDQRNAAIFSLGYWAGCRVSDVSWLQLDNTHVGPKIGWLNVGYKGGKYRDIDLLNEVRKPLYEYMKGDRLQSRFQESPFVFTSQRGGRLTENGIHHWFRTLKNTANKNEWPLIEDITFHDLRHDFAHRARAAGWLLEEIAVYLGHTKISGSPAIETTVRYTQPGREQIKSKLKDIRG